MGEDDSSRIFDEMLRDSGFVRKNNNNNNNKSISHPTTINTSLNASEREVADFWSQQRDYYNNKNSNSTNNGNNLPYEPTAILKVQKKRPFTWSDLLDLDFSR